MDRKIKIKTINASITCKLCNGYLINATAITECLHTFCKSCLIKHLETNTTCPTCNIFIHHSYPMQYIKFDRTLQDIVYKLVPNLYDSEQSREKTFYLEKGLPHPINALAPNEDSPKDEKTSTDLVQDDCRRDELINVCLECINNAKDKKFIRVSTKVTVSNLQRFLSNRFGHKNVDIYCNNAVLERSDSLKYIYLTRWRNDEMPLVLQYAIKL